MNLPIVYFSNIPLLHIQAQKSDKPIGLAHRFSVCYSCSANKTTCYLKGYFLSKLGLSF